METLSRGELTVQLMQMKANLQDYAAKQKYLNSALILIMKDLRDTVKELEKLVAGVIHYDHVPPTPTDKEDLEKLAKDPYRPDMYD
jgi:hypothetical protein